MRYATAADYWKANLNPFTRELEIVRRGGEGVDSWTFDLTSQVEGEFQPLTMVGGQTAELYVAGRIDGADGGIVYRVSLNWDGSSPNPSLECVLFSPSVGDVTSMVFHGTYNNSLVMFDYTNARLIRLNLLTQALAVLADSAAYPQLLGQASLLARIRSMASTGAPVGVAFFPQSGLEYDLLASAHGKSILVMRIANDGTVETVDRISF